jgi:hypothetical protein
MIKKFVVAVIVVFLFAMLYVAPAEAGGPKHQNQFTYSYRWAIQMMKAVQGRFCFMVGVSPADGPGDGWGPGDGTGNDGDGPEDGTGYGPGNENYQFQKYGTCLRSRYAYSYQQRGN